MKKEKNKETFPWQKVLVIAVGVLFVFMMVLSAMGMSWLQSFRTVRANDTVTLDVTLFDSTGRPILTTEENTYRAGLMIGGMPFLIAPLTVRAGYIGNPAYTGLDAANYYMSSPGTTLKFGILGQELDDLDVAVLGMKTGEKKTVPFSFTVPTIIFTDDELTTMGGNFTALQVGDLLPLGFSDAPMVSGLEGLESDPENGAMRLGTVINKTGTYVEVDHQYPTASISVRSIG